MTKDEIIEMGKQVGLWPAVTDIFAKELEAFANLVAAKEREACAKVCEQHPDGMTMLGGVYVACAEAIRARGEQA